MRFQIRSYRAASSPLDLALHLVGCAETVARRADRLVRLLRVLHLPVVRARLLGHRVCAVELAGLVARRGHRRLGQRGRVGAHVGDVAVLVKALGDAHRVLRREPKLAARLLLEGRGHERRRRPAGVGLALDRPDRELDALECGRERTHGFLVELDGVGRGELTGAGEVAALGNLVTVDRDEPRLEAAGLERGDDVPVLGGTELDPLALALDHEARRDRLDAACGEPLHHLPPENGGDLVAVETVEDAARLLRVDEALVDVASLA